MELGILFAYDLEHRRDVLTPLTLSEKVAPSTFKVCQTQEEAISFCKAGQQYYITTDEGYKIISPKRGHSSVFMYHKKDIEAYAETHNGSVSGFDPYATDDGGVFGHWFIAEIDHAGGLEAVMHMIAPLLADLHKYNVQYLLFSSGRKGAHLYIPFDYIKFPEEFANRMHDVSAAFANLLQETYKFTLDTGIYSIGHMIRCPYTSHDITRKPKIMLDVNKDYNPDMKLKEMVSPIQLSKDSAALIIQSVYMPPVFDTRKIWEVTPVKRTVEVASTKEIRDGLDWVPPTHQELCIYKMLNDPDPAERHKTMMRIIAWLYGLGVPRDFTYQVISKWNKSLTRALPQSEIDADMRTYGKYHWNCMDEIKQRYCVKSNTCFWWKSLHLIGNIPNSKERAVLLEAFLSRDKSKDIKLASIFNNMRVNMIPDDGHILTIIGPSGVGKSWIAINMALRATCNVLFFSYEMSKTSLDRRFATILGLDIETPEGRIELVKKTKHIFIEDDAQILFDHHVKIKRALENKYGISIGMMIVDYLQLVPVADPNNKQRVITNRTEAVNRVAFLAKMYAKTGRYVSVFLSQVPKSASGGGYTMIYAEDGKDSQAVQAMSDVILTTWRPKKMQATQSHNKSEDVDVTKQNEIDNMLMIYVGKNRNEEFENVFLPYQFTRGRGLIQELYTGKDYEIIIRDSNDGQL